MTAKIAYRSAFLEPTARGQPSGQPQPHDLNRFSSANSQMRKMDGTSTAAELNLYGGIEIGYVTQSIQKPPLKPRLKR